MPLETLRFVQGLSRTQGHLYHLFFDISPTWRCLLCFLTPGGVPETTRETFCNSWTNHGKSIHGKSMENPMQKPWEKPWKTQWEIHGKSMGNPWIIKTEKKETFPWYSMGTKKDPWKLGSDLTPNGIIID